MIKNERQYRITRAVTKGFETRLRELDVHVAAEEPLLRKAQTDAVTSQLEELSGQLEEYEALTSGEITSWHFSTLDELSDALIRARIASGLSQRDLAGQLGLKEQQIQRYEATDYEAASLARVLEIADTLGLRIEGSASVNKGKRVAEKQFTRMSS